MLSQRTLSNFGAYLQHDVGTRCNVAVMSRGPYLGGGARIPQGSSCIRSHRPLAAGFHDGSYVTTGRRGVGGHPAATRCVGNPLHLGEAAGRGSPVHPGSLHLPAPLLVTPAHGAMQTVAVAQAPAQSATMGTQAEPTPVRVSQSLFRTQLTHW